MALLNSMQEMCCIGNFSFDGCRVVLSNDDPSAPTKEKIRKTQE